MQRKSVLEMRRAATNPFPKPSEEYMRRVALIGHVVNNCGAVSRKYGGIPSPTSQHYYASVLFTTLCTRGVSLAILAPHSTWAQKAIEHWDYASIAGMTRSILEIRLALFYLCIEKLDREEWECRWNVFNLHDCISRSLLFAEFKDQQGQVTGSENLAEEQVAGLEKQAEELRDRLRSNSFFLKLPERQQAKFLRGRDAYMVALEEVAEKADVDRKMFRWLYRFLSSHVHGLPMSFYRVGDKDRGRGIYSTVEEGYISLCLSFASALLTKARDEVDELFSPFVDKDKNQHGLSR